MNIRQYIRESLERMFETESTQDVIKGSDIMNHFPFNVLPETRSDVDWRNRDVKGWGSVQVPSINADAYTSITSKDDIIGGESWKNPKTGFVINNPGFIQEFQKKYGEEPLFVLNPSAVWYDKVKIVNESYVKAITARRNYIDL